MFKQYKLIVFIVFLLALISFACESSSDPVVTAPEDAEAAAESGDAEEADEAEEAATEEPEPTVEPTSTPPVGTRRDNPAPVGSVILADDMEFTVLSVIRPADTIVKAGNPYNSDPETGNEYMFVEVTVTCALDSVEKCNYNSFNFSLLGSSGVSIESEIFISGVENLLESAEFYGEATISGYIPFIVPIDETDILLVYEPFLFGDTFYLALPEPTAQ